MKSHVVELQPAAVDAAVVAAAEPRQSTAGPRHPAGRLKEHVMTTKILAAAIAAAYASALFASAAHAGDRATIAMRLVPDATVPAACPEPEFGFVLGIYSMGGRSVGTGRTCISSIEGCDPFAAFCRSSVRSTFTLVLARGSLTVPMKLTEIWPTESAFIQRGSGQVRAGTGAYAAAWGHVEGGGAGAFDDQFAFTGRLVYVAELRGVR